jgi:hypothetical protein
MTASSHQFGEFEFDRSHLELRCLKHGYEKHTHVTEEPAYDFLRDDPRFQTILARLSLPATH